MDKSWWKKFRRKAKKLLHRSKKIKDIPDFDESNQQYKLVNVYLINYGGKKKKGVRAPPVSGNALYYVVDTDGEGVTLLHPILLEVYTASRRQFEKGISDVWWPNEEAIKDPNAKNRSGHFCNRFKVAETLLTRLKDCAKQEKLNAKKQRIVREAIADLKEIPLEQVPKYKLPEKVNHLNLWKETMAAKQYKKRATSDLKKFTNKKDEGDEKVSKKSKKNKKPNSDSDVSTKKVKKSSKKEKTEKKPKEVKAPRGKKTAMAVGLRLLLKKKGKKVSFETIGAEIQKAKGRKKPISEKSIKSKAKKMAKWAERNGMTLKVSSSGLTLS